MVLSDDHPVENPGVLGLDGSPPVVGAAERHEVLRGPSSQLVQQLCSKDSGAGISSGKVQHPLALCVFLRLHRLRPEGQEAWDHRLPKQHVSQLQPSRSPQLRHLVVGLLAEHLDLPLTFRCLLHLPRLVGDYASTEGLVPPAAAARDPGSYISAEEWDNYFAGMNEVRGFAVGDDDALPKAPATPARTVTMTPREPDVPPPG